MDFASERWVEAALWSLVAEGSLTGYVREVLDTTCTNLVTPLLAEEPERAVRMLASWHLPVRVCSLTYPYEALQEAKDLLGVLRVGGRVPERYAGLMALAIQQLRLTNLDLKSFVKTP